MMYLLPTSRSIIRNTIALLKLVSLALGFGLSLRYTDFLRYPVSVERRRLPVFNFSGTF